MAKVSMLAKFRTHDGKGDELIAAFQAMFDAVDGEPGTELYILNRSKEDPNVFWFYELYTDSDALGAHGSSDAMKQAGPAFGPLIADTELIIGEPLQAKGIAL
ncbi:MAG TPA: putative quinol monooxygenase [Acidimicrobiia bacterium]